MKPFIKEPILSTLCKQSKQAWKLWRDAGRPKKGPLLIKRNESKKVKLYILKCRACQEQKRIQYQDDFFKSKSFKRFKIT